MDQSITAGPDGTSGIGNLTPSHYQLTATQPGFANSSVSAVELAPGQALDLTLTLGLKRLTKRVYEALVSCLRRRLEGDHRQWTRTGASRTPVAAQLAAVSKRRLVLWRRSRHRSTRLQRAPAHGSALRGPSGKAWEDSRVKIYGWFEGSLNLSTSHQSNSWYMYEKDMPNVAGPLALETGPGAHSVPPARCAALPLSGLP